MSCTKSVKTPSRPFQIFPWYSSCSILRDKNGHKHFFTRRIAFFSKICVFNNHLGIKKCSYKCHSNCYNRGWTLINFSLRFVTIDITRKNRPKSFLHWKDGFFYKNCVFNNLVDPTEKNNVLHKKCQNTFQTLLDCSLTFVMFDTTR